MCRFRFAWPVLPLSLLLACDSGSTTVRQAVPEVNVSVLESLADPEGLSAIVSQDAIPAPESVSFPMDLAPHPDAAMESVLLQAYLIAESESGTGPQPRSDTARGGEWGGELALQIRLDRLALARTPAEGSLWDYSDAMLATVILERPGDERAWQRRTAQRMALDLAGSDSDSLFVNDSRLSVRIERQGCQAAWQAVTTLPGQVIGRQTRTGAGAGSRARPGTGSGSGSVSDAAAMASGNGTKAGLPVELSLEMQQCPEGISIAGLARWQAQAVPVDAHFPSPLSQTVVEAASTSADSRWHGHAWLSSSWGDLRATGGAVVIDTAVLHLQAHDSQVPLTLSIDRSKRRSGRGPQTVQASLLDASGLRRDVDVSWTDADSASGAVEAAESVHGRMPAGFDVATADGSIRLHLQPLVPPTASDGPEGAQWHGAVRSQGTHQGYGFVHYRLTAMNDASTESGSP